MNTYIEAHNKAEMIRAISAVPYTPGTVAIVCNVRADGTTTFRFDCNGYADEAHMEACLTRAKNRIKKSHASLWR